MGGPDAEHLHFAGHGIDFDLRHLRAENVSLPRPSGAIDRMETGCVRAEGSRAHRDNAAIFCSAYGFAHGDAMIGVLGPDFAIAGADRFGMDIPNLCHDIDQPLARLARGERDRVANHVGLTARTRVRGFRRTCRIIVADHDVLGLHAHLMRRDLRQHGEDALTDLGDSGRDLGAAAVVDLGPGSGAIDNRVLPDGKYQVVVQAFDVVSSDVVKRETALTITNADSTPPELQNFTVFPDTFTPNQDGIADRVRKELASLGEPANKNRLRAVK